MTKMGSYSDNASIMQQHGMIEPDDDIDPAFEAWIRDMDIRMDPPCERPDDAHGNSPQCQCNACRLSYAWSDIPTGSKKLMFERGMNVQKRG